MLLPGTLTSSAEEIYTPARYQLSDIYPNPFNPAARVQLQLERQGFVTAELITPLGEKLKTISQGNFSEGTHTIEVNAEGFRSGVYFVRFIISDAVRQNKSVEIRKAVLLK